MAPRLVCGLKTTGCPGRGQSRSSPTIVTEKTLKRFTQRISVDLDQPTTFLAAVLRHRKGDTTMRKILIAAILTSLMALSGSADQRVRVGAICNDGWVSTATGSGACSHHGGVRCWRYNDGTCTKP